jgi:hypothetical protein
VTDRPPTPWTTAQVRVVAACDLAAAVVVAIATHGAARRASLADQVVWIDVALGGLLLALVAGGWLFLVARRAVGARRRALLPEVVVAAPVLAPRPAATATWWWVAGTVRAHVEGCPMVAGKAATALAAKDVRAKRLQRCEVCG